MGHIFLSSKNVTTNKINWDDVMYIPNELHEKLYNRLAPELNDILLAKNGTIGKAALVDRDIEFDVYVTLAVIRLFKNYISPQYIHKIIESKYIQDFFKGEQKGIGVPNLHLENIRKTLVPLPPQSEQKRISETVEILLELVDSIESDKIDLSELIKQTKAKVLDLAIKGKLVPQDTNDEPADILLEKIREEKEKLIKEGKLKRDKNETFIFKNSDDNSYYEQIDGETVCIDDDLPFEIPDSWRWCKLKNMYNFIDYRGKTPNKVKSGIPLITAKNVKNGYIDYSIKEYITEEEYEDRQSRGISQKGDILFTTEAPLGNVAIADIENYSAGQRLITLQQYNQNNCYINNGFSMYYILSKEFQDMLIEKRTGTTVTGIKAEKLKELFVPLPPIKEQNRIVAKIKSIFTQLDTIQEIFLQ